MAEVWESRPVVEDRFFFFFCFVTPCLIYSLLVSSIHGISPTKGPFVHLYNASFNVFLQSPL